MRGRWVAFVAGLPALACGFDRERDIDVEALGTGTLRLRLTGAIALDATWNGLGPDGLAAFDGHPSLALPWPTPGRSHLWRSGPAGRPPGPWRVSGCTDDAGFVWAGEAKSSGWLCLDIDETKVGMSIGLYEVYPGDSGWTLHADHTEGPIGPTGSVTVRGEVLKNGTTPMGPVELTLAWAFDPAASRRWTYRHHPRRAW